MRLLILGAGGMLGHRLCRLLADRFELWGTFHGSLAGYWPLNLLPAEHSIGGVDAQRFETVCAAINQAKPNVVVNCIGIVKQRDEAKQAIPSIYVNALFPHQLADLCAERGIRLFQISTDCVFSGFRGRYTEIDLPDPVDLYGRTKLLGELDRPNCLTLRTSIIGWQVYNFSGLLSWFAMQRGKRIKGYRRAIYSGFSTTTLAQLIGDLVETRLDLHGLYHVSSEPISKYDLLVRLRDILGWKDITIDEDDQFLCDRSLIGSRFTATTGWMSPSWDTMLAGLAAEWAEYSRGYEQSHSRPGRHEVGPEPLE